RIGYPVVLKLMSTLHSHKSDIGGVKVDIRSRDELGLALGDLRAAADEHKVPMDDFQLLISRFVSSGSELIVGITKDSQLGRVLLVGVGGVYTEVISKTITRLMPLSFSETRTLAKQAMLLVPQRHSSPVSIEPLLG